MHVDYQQSIEQPLITVGPLVFPFAALFSRNPSIHGLHDSAPKRVWSYISQRLLSSYGITTSTSEVF